MTRPSAAGTVVLAWFAGLLPALGVAAATRLGPVLLLVTPRHGVHVGDVVALVAGVSYAAAITGAVAPRLRP